MGKGLQDKLLLRPAALDRIEAAVAAAEKSTCCEIIVVIAPASSRYEGRGLRAAAAVSLLVFLALYNVNVLAFGYYPDALMLLVEAVVLGAVAAIAFSRWAPLRRLLTTRAQRNAAVQRASGATFFEERVGSTKDRNAVLLYLSVLEGGCRVLADVGLVARAHDAPFGEVQGALDNAAGGDAVQLVCDAIAKIGAICAVHFPMQPGDINELPDRPQVRLP
ncbi:MAG: hypothetical protein IT462_12850 [Planctomycetes bacterium]|nr:hypothetical protein [Planctomycetota bacterium]